MKNNPFLNGAEEEMDLIPAYAKHFFVYTETEVFDEKGVLPRFIPDLKGIEGDPSDNIPGVKGVSSAAAPLIMEYEGMTELYKAINTCVGDAKAEKELTDFWKQELGIKRSPLKALKEHCQTAFLSKELATIRCYCPEVIRYQLSEHPIASINKDVFNQKMQDLDIRIRW